jgi:hypothetical protein
MRMETLKYQFVVVKWKDISTKHGWLEHDHVDHFIMDDDENIVYQAGFLYEEDETQMVLLNSYFKTQDLLGDVTKIPKGAVLEIMRPIWIPDEAKTAPAPDLSWFERHTATSRTDIDYDARS